MMGVIILFLRQLKMVNYKQGSLNLMKLLPDSLKGVFVSDVELLWIRNTCPFLKDVVIYNLLKFKVEESLKLFSVGV